MGKYFWLQCKRLLRFLPGALCVIGILLGGLYGALTMLLQRDASGEENQKVNIAISGQTEDAFLQMGLTALETFDSTRFSIQILQMEEEDAARALARGDIAAYAVLPDGFMDAAFSGDILPIKFVSTSGASDLVSVFKSEVTRVITDLLIASQKGVFGMRDAVWENGDIRNLGSKMDALSFRYVDCILIRDDVYRLEELGIADSLDFGQYLICGLGIVFFLLACLPFAPLQIRQDPALGRLLRAKGKSAVSQTLCDFFAYTLCLLLIAGALLLAAAILAPEQVADLTLGHSIPVLLFAATYSFMLFSLASDLMSGVLLQFFLTLGLCFVSGCMYPVYFFPAGLQKIAAWLPTGLARRQLAGCITGSADSGVTFALLGLCAAFLGISLWARGRKIRGVEP